MADPGGVTVKSETRNLAKLDDACRKQQLGEGWFKTLEDVPQCAISMTVRQILKSKQIICVVPDARKAQAVARCFPGDISPLAPSFIVRAHAHSWIYLDRTLLRCCDLS